MSEILQDLTPSALVGAIGANHTAFPMLFCDSQRVEVHDDPELGWMSSDIPFPYLNAVVRTQLPPERADRAIEAAIARCRERNVPMLWFTGPSTQPADLGRRLEAHGFAHADDMAGMALDLLAMDESAPTPPDLVVETVGDVETLRHWCHVLSVGFRFPAFMEALWPEIFAVAAQRLPVIVRHFIGWSDGQAVATSSLVVAAGVAGIYCVATLPEVRRKGIATAMTLAALRQGRALGYRVAVLQASEMGAGVYRRIGFREYCTFGGYTWPAEAEQV